MLHRNSQKRIYGEYVYFVTVCTKDRMPYFRDKVLCELWVRQLKLLKEIKQIKCYSFCLLLDHFHILFRPMGNENYSRCMQFLKRHFARNANILLGYSNPNAGGNGHSHVRDFDDIDNWVIVNRNKIVEYPKFEWQSSFYDHVIRDERDLENHFNYCQFNFQKHNLPNNWPYTSLNYPEMIDPAT